MYPTRLIHLLLVTLGFIAVAQAVSQNIDGSQENALVKKQDDAADSASVAPVQSTAPQPSASPSEPADEETTTAANDPPVESEATTTPPTTSTPPTTTPTPSAQPSSDNGGGGADASTTPAPSAAPSSPQSSPTTSAQDNSNNDNDNNNDNSSADSGDNETTASSAQAETTAEPVTSTVRTVFVTTNAQGDETSVTSESVITSTPGLSAEDNDDGGGGGMPTKTRNIVIGVVVGVGGAIILGALAFVGFRIHNRKKKQEENDGLMDYNTAGTSAFNSEPKPDAMSGSTATNNRSPFQTNLESYHQPTQVNASSNF